MNERVGGPAALVLTATVARRYYIEGETKSDIAAQLGLSRFKVARLLEQARAAGVVRIELDSPGEINLDLSVRLRTAYDLRHCVVIDGPEDDDELLRAALGRAAAELLTEIVEPGDVLGLAWARSVMAIRTSLTRLAQCDVVQLTGALASHVDESPVELVREVARRSNGSAFSFYAPMILQDAATARALRTQPEVARAVSKFPEVTKAVLGVGAWREGQSKVRDALTEEEWGELGEAVDPAIAEVGATPTRCSRRGGGRRGADAPRRSTGDPGPAGSLMRLTEERLIASPAASSCVGMKNAKDGFEGAIERARAVLGREQHRPLHPQLAARRGHLHGDRGRARVPRRVRARAQPLPRQGPLAFMDHSQRMAPIAAVILPLFVTPLHGTARKSTSGPRSWRLPHVPAAVRDLDHERVLPDRERRSLEEAAHDRRRDALGGLPGHRDDR